MTDRDILDEALARWIGDGEIMASRYWREHRETIVVVKRDDEYDCFRAFVLGFGEASEAAVSADKQGVSTAAAIAYTLAA